VIDCINHFGARIGGADVQCLHLLGNIKDASTIPQTAGASSRYIKESSSGYIMHF
jgi:hypothetical protein